MEEGEQKLASKMKSLYDSVQQKKKALETAATGYEKAGREKQNADTKYSIGMLSQDEYLREQMNYIQRTAEYRSADLAFTQAMMHMTGPYWESRTLKHRGGGAAAKERISEGMGRFSAHKKADQRRRRIG